MKLSFSLFAVACVLPSSVAGFVPSASARSSSALKATIEKTKLIPPMKVADLANTAEEQYNKNVQKTYG